MVHWEQMGQQAIRTAVFRNISEQLFQLFSQINFYMPLQDTTTTLQYFF